MFWICKYCGKLNDKKIQQEEFVFYIGFAVLAFVGGVYAGFDRNMSLSLFCGIMFATCVWAAHKSREYAEDKDERELREEYERMKYREQLEEDERRRQEKTDNER